MNLKYMKVSLFHVTFSRHSNLLRCTCISHIQPFCSVCETAVVRSVSVCVFIIINIKIYLFIIIFDCFFICFIGFICIVLLYFRHISVCVMFDISSGSWSDL